MKMTRVGRWGHKELRKSWNMTGVVLIFGLTQMTLSALARFPRAFTGTATGLHDE